MALSNDSKYWAKEVMLGLNALGMNSEITAEITEGGIR